MTIDERIARAQLRMNIDFELKAEQIKALKECFNGKDVICVLPTGFGKSIIYQLLPFLYDEPQTVLILSPLNSIMKDQVLKLTKKNIAACYLDIAGLEGYTFHLQQETSSDKLSDEGDEDIARDIEEEFVKCSVPVDELLSGKYKLIYAHPEAILRTEVGRAIVKKNKGNICCVAVDEAHMIYEWGEEFRTDFARIDEILSKCGSVPALVLTATASPKIKEHIKKSLSLNQPTIIENSIDRKNIMYFKYERMATSSQSDDLDEILTDAVHKLRENPGSFPVTIIYTNLENISYGYRFLESALGERQYIGTPCPENRIFAMYHACYTEPMKNHIVCELIKTNPKIRVVLATVALGMGLDAGSIENVIHFGAPTSVEKYLQETGRAGRNGQQAKAVLYYNNFDIRGNRPGITEEMRLYCKLNTCLREFILNCVQPNSVSTVSKEKCCQFCLGQIGQNIEENTTQESVN